MCISKYRRTIVNHGIVVLQRKNKNLISSLSSEDDSPASSTGPSPRPEEADESIEVGPKSIKAELTNCKYLEDTSTTIYGLKFYGSPWQPEFCGWGFNLKRGRTILDKWDLIPGTSSEIK